MTLLANMPVLRTALQRMLTDTGTITKPGEGQGEFNEATGQYDDPLPVTIYAGRMLIRPDGENRRAEVIQGAAYVLTRYEITLPAEAEVFRNQILTVTESKHDPMLIGRSMTLVDVKMDTWAISRVCVAERQS